MYIYIYRFSHKKDILTTIGPDATYTYSSLCQGSYLTDKQIYFKKISKS